MGEGGGGGEKRGEEGTVRRPPATANKALQSHNANLMSYY